MGKSPFVITISRQLGSGGSYLGKCVAKRLGIYYLDREVVRDIAANCSYQKNELSAYDEKAARFWKRLFVPGLSYQCFASAGIIYPNASNLFEMQADIISKAADEKSAVIVGRGPLHTSGPAQAFKRFFTCRHSFPAAACCGFVRRIRTTSMKMIEKYDVEGPNTLNKSPETTGRMPLIITFASIRRGGFGKR